MFTFKTLNVPGQLDGVILMNPTAALYSGRLFDFPPSSLSPSDLAYAHLSSPRCHAACVVVDFGGDRENLQQQVSQLYQAARWVVDASQILLVWFGQEPGVFGLQRGESGYLRRVARKVHTNCIWCFSWRHTTTYPVFDHQWWVYQKDLQIWIVLRSSNYMRMMIA